MFNLLPVYKSSSSPVINAAAASSRCPNINVCSINIEIRGRLLEFVQGSYPKIMLIC